MVEVRAHQARPPAGSAMTTSVVSVRSVVYLSSVNRPLVAGVGGTPFYGQLVEPGKAFGALHEFIGGAAETGAALLAQPGRLVGTVFLKVEAVTRIGLGRPGVSAGDGGRSLQAADEHDCSLLDPSERFLIWGLLRKLLERK